MPAPKKSHTEFQKQSEFESLLAKLSCAATEALNIQRAYIRSGWLSMNEETKLIRLKKELMVLCKTWEETVKHGAITVKDWS